MISLEEVKKLIEAELRPFKAKITEYEGKIAELEYSQNFLSSKYDCLLKQIQRINSKNNKVEKEVIDLHAIVWKYHALTKTCYAKSSVVRMLSDL